MGTNNRMERRSHSKHNDPHRRRRTHRKAKIRKPMPRQIITRTDSASTGCTPPGTIIPDQTTIKQKSNRAWENIVLHYLSKLKKVWLPCTPANENEMVHPVMPANRENSATKFRRERHNEHRNLHYSKYQPTSPTISTVPSNFCLSGKRKAFNIVANAIEYGLANGIVSKNGNFFWLTHKLKKNKQKRGRSSLCTNCRVCTDGVDTVTSRSPTANNRENDENIGHALAVNRSRPKVSKTKSILHTNNLKVKQVPSLKMHPTKSARSLKSRKSRGGIVTQKSTHKDIIPLIQSKSKKSTIKVPCNIRDGHVDRTDIAKSKERGCKCSKCLKSYTFW